jgi:hypothetical protein
MKEYTTPSYDECLQILDRLVEDKRWEVRSAVARLGYGLDKLIDDEEPFVRLIVVRQGYGLDKLIHDPFEIVREAANIELQRLQQ